MGGVDPWVVRESSWPLRRRVAAGSVSAPVLSLRELARWGVLVVLAAVGGTLGAAAARSLNAFVPAYCAAAVSLAVGAGVRRSETRKAGGGPSGPAVLRSVTQVIERGWLFRILLAAAILLAVVPPLAMTAAMGVDYRYPLWLDFLMVILLGGFPLWPPVLLRLARRSERSVRSPRSA